MGTGIHPRVTESTLKQVKEHIDFIYEITNTMNGYTGSISGNGTRFRHIVRIMVERDILSKTQADRRTWRYKWKSPLAPTKVLYGSIAPEMVSRERAWQKKSLDNKKAKPAVETPEPLENTTKDNPLNKYSIDELWGELKRRGCCIEGNKLALKTVKYFE